MPEFEYMSDTTDMPIGHLHMVNGDFWAVCRLQDTLLVLAEAIQVES